MTKIPLIFILMVIFSLSNYTTNRESSEEKAHELTVEMIHSTREIRNITYTMKRIERIKGKMNTQISEVKVNRIPFKVYSKQKFPKEGIEVLFVKGENHGKAIVNPNGFPWINLKLDPYGKIMRKDQHHTILNSGYDHVISIIEHLQTKYGEASKKMLQIRGEVVWNGRKCWKIEFDNPHFGFAKYTVRKGESLSAIADRSKINEYMIIENNDHVKDFRDVSGEDVISIPNDYCKRMIVYIDKDRLIPLLFKIYDHRGLFEQYEFTDVQLDVTIEDGEFTVEYDGYGF